MRTPREIQGVVDPVGSFLDENNKRPAVCLRVGRTEWAALNRAAADCGLSRQAMARQLVCLGLRELGAISA